jgi:tRNA(Ile2) C34 agmatinyltransferase TiaS
MSVNGVELSQMMRARCPECGWVSTVKGEDGFYCKNPKCDVRLIVGSGLIVIKDKLTC